MTSDPFRILATRPFDEEAVQPLRTEPGVDFAMLEEGEAEDVGRLREAAASAHGLLTMLTERIDEQLMRACPGLRVVSNFAVGTDNIDVDAARRRGIVVCNTPDVLTETTAEMAVALMFAVSRRLVEADRYVRTGRWTGWEPTALLGVDLAGRTLGVVGAGRIGAAVARRGRALGMNVVYTARTAKPELEAECRAQRLELDELLRRSHVVSLHVPLEDATHHLLSTERLDLLGPDAILINTARGPIVDEGALVGKLKRGEIYGAGLDVFEKEPNPSPELLSLDNVVLAPHVGSATVATRRRMADCAVENLLRFKRGEEPVSTVT